MSKPAVLISIRPEWVGKILSSEKTVEIRKRKPYFPAPFKCYIYCTKGGDGEYVAMWRNGIFLRRESYRANGTVCAEFTCDSIKPILPPFTENEGTCLTPDQIKRYAGDWELWLQAWHISDVKVYDKPKGVNTFYKWNSSGDDIRPCVNGKKCEHLGFDYTEDCEICKIDFDGENCPFLKVNRPPQSWCYVEELE